MRIDKGCTYMSTIHMYIDDWIPCVYTFVRAFSNKYNFLCLIYVQIQTFAHISHILMECIVEYDFDDDDDDDDDCDAVNGAFIFFSWIYIQFNTRKKGKVLELKYLLLRIIICRHRVCDREWVRQKKRQIVKFILRIWCVIKLYSEKERKDEAQKLMSLCVSTNYVYLYTGAHLQMQDD